MFHSINKIKISLQSKQVTYKSGVCKKFASGGKEGEDGGEKGQY